jgi:hypothetical protein
MHDQSDYKLLTDTGSGKTYETPKAWITDG